MDWERALVSKAAQTGAIETFIAEGIHGGYIHGHNVLPRAAS